MAMPFLISPTYSGSGILAKAVLPAILLEKPKT
jgi:hypothetical protein